MAIASVARKATIRRDDTILKTQALVNNQKKVAKQLELQQQKITADQEEAKAKRSAKNLELAMKTGDIKDTRFAQGFRPLMTKFQNLNAGGGSQVEIESHIAKMDNYTKIANAAFGDTQSILTDIAGTESQRELRNRDAITAELSKYIDGTNVEDFDKTKAQELVKNSLSTYNTQKSIENWSETQQENVNTSMAVKVGALFSQVEQTKQASQFLKIDPNTKRVQIGKDGKPIVVISNENLHSFKNASHGHKLAIAAYQEANKTRSLVTKIGLDGEPEPSFDFPSELEAMESLLRDSGQFNIDEDTTTQVRNTPQERIVSDKKAAAKAEALEVRVDFITGKSSNVVANLKGQTGVVASGQRTGSDGNPIGDVETTGSKKVKGGVEYTIVTDLRKLQETSPEAIMVDINGDGREEPVATITGTAPIIEIRKIMVTDKDKESGYIELNDYFNRSVPSAQRIGGDTFINASRKRKPAEEKISPAKQAMIDRLEALKKKNP